MAQSPFEGWKEGKKQTGLEHQIERRLCGALLEFPQEFINDLLPSVIAEFLFLRSVY